MVSTSCSFNNNFLLFRNSKDDFEVKVLCILLLSDFNIPKEICIKIITFLRLHLELLFSGGGGGYFEREDLNRKRNCPYFPYCTWNITINTDARQLKLTFIHLKIPMSVRQK